MRVYRCLASIFHFIRLRSPGVEFEAVTASLKQKSVVNEPIPMFICAQNTKGCTGEGDT